MSKPKFEVNSEDYIKDIHFLYEIMNNLKDVEEIKKFFKDILTSSELRMLKRRWHIANLLIEGKEIREVAMISKTSTQTVSKIKKIMEEGNGGILLAIERSKKKISESSSKSKNFISSPKFVKNWFK